MRILGLVFSWVRPTDVRTFLACYFMMYRFLRWRLYPDAETQGDMPSWLYPTDSQKTILHPVCIDFLPWPGLRDYLIHNIHQRQHHSVIMYMRAVRFSWPEDEDFFSPSAQGDLVLTERFEEAMYAYERW